MGNTTDATRRGLPIECLPPAAASETRELIAAGCAVILVDPNDWEEPPDYPAALIVRRRDQSFGASILFGDVAQPLLPDIIGEVRRTIADDARWRQIATPCDDLEIGYFEMTRKGEATCR